MSWFYVKFMFGKYINIFTEFAIFTKPTMIAIKQEFVAKNFILITLMSLNSYHGQVQAINK